MSSPSSTGSATAADDPSSSSSLQGQVDYPESNILHYLLTHDLYTTSPQLCTLTENRFRQTFTDSSGKQTPLFCWKGRIQTDPDCVIGTTCSPYSYTEARSQFCKTWGCTPNLYVSNAGTVDANIPVTNQRGGIVVYNNKEKCKGGFASQLNCLMDGFRQSVANIMDPRYRGRFLIGMTAMIIFAIVAAVAYRNYRKKYGKRKHISPI